MGKFLRERLKLTIHPKKISLRKLHQGVDFLGYVIFPKHRLLRIKTKRRIFSKLRKRIEEYRRGEASQPQVEQSLQSYLGVLSHANAYKLSQDLRNQLWLTDLTRCLEKI
ncbi:MAG: RNA-directed DNA polymerase [Parcubacteria group bacterium Greene0416_39]|nr:MAG: RNA-directed DNA polymerase [Parcubacteria group bacterium Greene0416_39]TSC97384.1 MAG: RNA-directed DNA polymerase [Parcubacteria group bacterium Greene1014_47]